jgi:ribonuclease E
MVGANGGASETSRDDAQLLRRAMQAASAAEDEPTLEPAADGADTADRAGQETASAPDEVRGEAEALELAPLSVSSEEAAPVADAADELSEAAVDGVESELPASAGPRSHDDPQMDDASATLPSEYAFIEIDEADAEPIDAVEPAACEQEHGEPAEEDAAPLAVASNDEEERQVEELSASDEPVAIEEAAGLTVAEDENAEPLIAEEILPSAEQGEAAAEEAAAKKPRKKRAAGKRKSAPKSASRKSKEAEPAEPPEDDVWVSDAVAWSLSGAWHEGECSLPDNPECPRRLEELREAAADGRLTIWGRTEDAGTWQPIEASYWKSGTVEPGSLAEGGENVVAEPKAAAKAKGKKAARKYSALKVSKSQVEELWSPEAMH